MYTKMNLFYEVKSVVVPNVIKEVSCASTVFFGEYRDGEICSDEKGQGKQ